MTAPQHPEFPSPAYVIRVRAELSGQFTAEAAGLPDFRATADTREQAIERVRDLLNQGLAAGDLVAVTPQPAQRRFAGHSRDDPDFDQYLEAIQSYREQLDQQQCSDSSSTPTT